MLLSNTSKRLRKVVTSVSIPASQTVETDGDDGPEEMTVDESMVFHAEDNTSATDCADFEHPAALRIQTRAKRYQNSVSWHIRILVNDY